MVIFSADSCAADPSWLQVRNWDEFEALSCEPDGFWIDSDWPGEPAALAAALRASRWWGRLAFSALPCTEPLLDGWLDLPTARLRCARAQLAKAGVVADPSILLPAEKLLLYLYIRGEHELLPRYEPTSKTRYTYPLADALGGEPGIEAVGQLVRAGLLSPLRLVDRIRTCPDCGSGHLPRQRHAPALHQAPGGGRERQHHGNGAGLERIDPAGLLHAVHRRLGGRAVDRQVRAHRMNQVSATGAVHPVLAAIKPRRRRTQGFY